MALVLFQIGGCYLIAGHDILDVDKLPLKVIYHPLYGMNMYVLISCVYGVIEVIDHVTLS